MINYNPFIEFTQELFPSISPYTAENVKKSLDQFKAEGKTLNAFCNKPLVYNAQGDIFDNVKFPYIDDNGNIGIYETEAMLLSNTCDAQRNQYLNFAAIFNINEFDFDESTMFEIKNNKVYNFLYFPDNQMYDKIVDFSQIVSVPLEIFNKMAEHQKNKKLLSLSQFGYYLFLCKLTIFFMRPEDKESNADRVHNILV